MTASSGASAAFGLWSQRACPDIAGYRPPTSPRPGEHLNERPALHLAAFAATDTSPEVFGLGAFVVRTGDLILDAGLLIPDDIDEVTLAGLRDWASSHLVETPLGLRALRLLKRTQFCRGLLNRLGYAGWGWIVGADLGRTFALLAEHWAPSAPTRHGGRSSGWAGGWTLGTPGWGRLLTGKDGRTRWHSDTGRPVLRVMAVGEAGVRLAWGRPPSSFEGKLRGARDRQKRPFPGRFLDVIPAADALDGCESSSLADHLEAWALPVVEDRYALPATPEGAESAWAAVEAIAELAVRVDVAGATWAGGLDLPRLTSAASVGSQLLGRMGVRAPLDKFCLPATEHAAWFRTFSGGRCEGNLLGQVFPGTDVDLRSGYPACASLLGWWSYQTAETVEAVDFTAEARQLVTSIVGQELTPAQLIRHVLDPGFVRCVVAPRGELFPVNTPGADGQPGLDLRPVHAERLDVTLADAVAASVLAGRAVEVVEAVRLVPEGRQEALRPVTIPSPSGDPVCLDPGEDPIATMARRRTEAKAAGDQRLARVFRLVMNSTVYGQPARVDADRRGPEVPGPWFFPALAASVTGACRLMLAVLQAEVEGRGGVFAYCDSDGALIPCSDEGGLFPDGRRILTRAELAELLASFDDLDPFGDGLPVWTIKVAGNAVAFGRKRWGCQPDAGGIEHTLTGLGDCVALPGDPEWASRGVAAVMDATARGWAPGKLNGPHLDNLDAWPVLYRQQARRPDALAKLPAALGARPFCRTVEAPNEVGSPGVAFDAGGSLADWAALSWVVKDRPARLSFDPEDVAVYGRAAVILRPLANQVRLWAVVKPDRSQEPIRLDPALCRMLGSDAGRWRDETPQTVIADLDVPSLLLRVGRELGSGRLAELAKLPLRTSEAIAAGRTPRGDTIDRLNDADLVALVDALAAGPRTCAGCGEPATGRSRWCSEACRKRTTRAANRPESACPTCGTTFKPERHQRYCSPACAPKRGTYRCAGRSSGCIARVSTRGGWCFDCQSRLCHKCLSAIAEPDVGVCEACFWADKPTCADPNCKAQFNPSDADQTLCPYHRRLEAAHAEQF